MLGLAAAIVIVVWATFVTITTISFASNPFEELKPRAIEALQDGGFAVVCVLVPIVLIFVPVALAYKLLTGV